MVAARLGVKVRARGRVRERVEVRMAARVRVRVRVTARVKESRRFVQRRTCHPGCTPRRLYRRRRTQSSRAPLSAPACAPRAAPRARCLGSLGKGPRLPPSCRRGRRLQKVPAAPTRRETRGVAPPAEGRSGCREGRGEECAEGAQRVQRASGEGKARVRRGRGERGRGEGEGRVRGGRGEGAERVPAAAGTLSALRDARAAAAPWLALSPCYDRAASSPAVVRVRSEGGRG